MNQRKLKKNNKELRDNNNTTLSNDQIYNFLNDNSYWSVINPNKISPQFNLFPETYGTSESNHKVVKSTEKGTSNMVYASSTGYNNGKYYWTIKIHSKTSYDAYGVIGILNNVKNYGSYICSNAPHVSYGYQGNMYKNNYSFSNNDEIKVLLDCDNKIVAFYKNNVLTGFGFIPKEMNICYPAVQSYGANFHVQVTS